MSIMADSIYLQDATTSPEVEKKEIKAPLDLSHHFSRVTKARESSNVKQFYKYFAIPGIGNLAGGLPHASLFPYDTLEASVALPNRFTPTPNKPNGLDNITEGIAATTLDKATSTSAHVVVPHLSPATDLSRKIDLTTALQYGTAQGYPPLFSFVRQFARENLHPNVPYTGGPEINLTNGNTDGFSKTLEALSNVWSEERDWIREREGMLCEEYAFGSAIQQARPRGLQIVPVKIDLEGMLASGKGGLEDVLANWDERTGKRPHLMYTVTIGQNPTSGVLSVQRRKEIYAICSKYDVIIIEDDPYWYLQFPSAAEHEAASRIMSHNPTNNLLPHTLSKDEKSSGYAFLDSLVPSYLSVDTEGRVVRLDTFSKTVAPGCRLGWITGQPAIMERILRITESSTQQPSGFVQAMVAELIMGPQEKTDGGRGGSKDGSGWKMDGWIRWLEGLRGVYERRMNRMCSILEDGKYQLKQSTPIKKDDDDWAVVTKTPMYTFDWPRGGMFVWIELYLENHPLWKKAPPQKIAQALWLHLTTKPFLVLVSPGAIFCPTEEIREANGWRFFRICFAAVTEEEIDASSERFVAGMNAFWRLKKVEDLDAILDTARVDPEECVDMGINFAC